MRKNLRFLAVAGLAAVSSCKMDAFLFNQQRLDAYTLPGNTIPSSLIEPVTLQSGGETLYGYWVGSNGNRPGITILYFHGNKHNIDEYWDRVMFLHDVGVNVFIFDYRGFGRSSGVSTETGLHEDGEAALQYVLSRGVRPDSLGYYGYSLGNVPSLFLAAYVQRPRFVIAEAPFASAASLAQGSSALALPQGWLTEGRFDNVAAVQNSSAPLLVLHGEVDDFVRFRDNGRVVYEESPAFPKRLRVIPGALHENVPQTMGLAAYRAEITDWINRSESSGN